MQVQATKVEHGDPTSQGKNKMSWKVYELLCNILLEGDDEEYIFAHAFLTLEWNLMSHSENVVDCYAESLL